MQYETLRERVMTDPSVHNWVKDLIAKLEDKDIVDAMHGIELASKVIKMRYQKIVGTV